MSTGGRAGRVADAGTSGAGPWHRAGGLLPVAFPAARPRWVLAAAAILVTLSCAGCGDDGPSAMLDDYVERLAGVLRVDPGEVEGYRAQLLAYPARRHRRLPLADVRIGLLDFLDLRRCGLYRIVAERNSVLGRVMPVSQQLVYEHRLLVSLRACLRQLPGDGADRRALREKLDQVEAIKIADLPRAYWNATFGSPEFEHMLSLAASPLPVGALDRDSAAIERALDRLAAIGPRLGHASLELDSGRLEGHYQALLARRLAGELLGAVDLLRHHLDAAAQVLETRLAQGPVCTPDKPGPSARAVEAVFREHYVARVRPYLATVHRQARDWLTLVNRLAHEQRGHSTPAFDAYFEAQLSMQANGALWPRFQRARERHTQAWRAVLVQCGAGIAT